MHGSSRGELPKLRIGSMLWFDQGRATWGKASAEGFYEFRLDQKCRANPPPEGKSSEA